MSWLNMDDTAPQKIKDIIDMDGNISIVVGANPNLDAMAAALGLYLSLESFGKNVTVASPTEPIVELSSLVGIDRVKNSINGAESGDLTVSFPYREGEIEKVSYTLEDGFLNIVVKEGKSGLSFSEKDVRFKRGGGNFSGSLFIVGTQRVSDLGNLFDTEALKNTKVINIDNKVDNQGFGDVALVSPRFSSVCEIVANLIKSFNLVIDIDIAQNLLSGIAFATDNFQKANTSSLAFEMSAFLMKKGAVRLRETSKKDQKFEENSFFPPFPAPLQSAVKTQIRSNVFGKMKPQRNNFPQKQQSEDAAPSDWLAPKIYKGSTLI